MLEYVVISLLVSIGWHIGKIFGHALDEVVGARLHKANWYKKLLTPGPKPKQTQSKPYKGTTMGFTKTNEL